MDRERFFAYCVIITLLVTAGIFTALSFAVFTFINSIFDKVFIMFVMYFACGTIFAWVWDVLDRE